MMPMNWIRWFSYDWCEWRCSFAFSFGGRPPLGECEKSGECEGMKEEWWLGATLLILYRDPFCFTPVLYAIVLVCRCRVFSLTADITSNALPCQRGQRDSEWWWLSTREGIWLVYSHTNERISMRVNLSLYFVVWASNSCARLCSWMLYDHHDC